MPAELALELDLLGDFARRQPVVGEPQRLIVDEAICR
jgi:hypothetical protein